MANVIFKVGTRAEYDLIKEKSQDTLYWLEDEQALYKGDSLYAIGKPATPQKAGLLSAVDKQKLDDLAKGEITSLTSEDQSITISDAEHGRDLKVNISDADGNQIELKKDDYPGLFVSDMKLALEKQEEGAGDAAATYKLKITKGESETYADGEISIPKDVFFEKCELKTVEVPNEPYSPSEVGDPYLDVTLTNGTKSYISMKGVVDTAKFVVKSVKGGNGEALIFNEGDGGGAKFTNKDGLESFVGVNDGGKGGLAAQIYADVKEDGTYRGSRINVFHDGIYYVSKANQKNGKKINDAECEIAIRGDITAATV